MTRYTKPQPLDETSDVSEFDSSTPVLDSWLRGRAVKIQLSGASRTFVTCSIEDRQRVAGFYSLAASAVALDVAPGPVRRNMPDPIAVVQLGRLAVHRGHQGGGLGASLLQDAVRRAAGVAGTIGVRALLVHALDDSAAAFYRRFGFIASPIDPDTLFLSIQQIRASLQKVNT